METVEQNSPEASIADEQIWHELGSSIVRAAGVSYAGELPHPPRVKPAEFEPFPTLP